MNNTHTELPMIKTYRSPKTIIKKSTKGGKGLFVNENILADEIIAIRAGHIVNRKEALKLDKKVGDLSLQITDEFYIFPGSSTKKCPISLFCNFAIYHSHPILTTCCGTYPIASIS
jgi:uncharacterized protein